MRVSSATAKTFTWYTLLKSAVVVSAKGLFANAPALLIDLKNYADLLAGAHFGIVFQVAGSASSEGVGSKRYGLATRQPT